MSNEKCYVFNDGRCVIGDFVEHVSGSGVSFTVLSNCVVSDIFTREKSKQEKMTIYHNIICPDNIEIVKFQED